MGKIHNRCIWVKDNNRAPKEYIITDNLAE